MDIPLNEEDWTRLRYETILPVYANNGISYSCTQRYIDDYQEFSDHSDVPFISLAESTQELTSFLMEEPSDDIKEALSRLRQARWNPVWGPGIIIKALHDIDSAFFNSRLRGNIVVRWSNTEEIARVGSLQNKKEVSGECFCLSCPEEDLRQTTVYLNAEMIFSQPTACEEMWQTVFHELMHAYFIATTGISDGDEHYDSHRQMPNSHGWVYCWVLSHVDHRARTYLGMAVIHQDENYRLDLSTEYSRILGDVVTFRSSWRPPRLSLRQIYKEMGDAVARGLTEWAGCGGFVSL